MAEYARALQELEERVAPMGDTQGASAVHARAARRPKPPIPKRHPMKRKLDTSPTWEAKKCKWVRKRNKPTPPSVQPLSREINIRDGGNSGQIPPCQSPRIEALTSPG